MSNNAGYLVWFKAYGKIYCEKWRNKPTPEQEFCLGVLRVHPLPESEYGLSWEELEEKYPPPDTENLV